MISYLFMYFLKQRPPRDVEILFLEPAKNGRITWESYATHQLYEKYSIQVRPPKYRNLEITKPVTVVIQVRRVFDHRCRDAVTFQYLPLPPRTPGKQLYRYQRN